MAATAAEKPPKRAPRVMLAVRIAEDGITALDRAAKHKGLTRSTAIRQAIREWVARNDPTRSR